MLKNIFFPGKYIQGLNALEEMESIVKTFGKQAMIIASPTVCNKILPERKIDLSFFQVEQFNGECCEKELSRLASIIENKKITVLVAMGGGKTIDTAKIIADRKDIPVVIVPTIASTDAPCSGCAVVYSEQGVFESVYYQKLNPAAVIVDMNIITKAPVRFLVAGMGDALATWFEARSCNQTQSKNECGGISTLTGLNLAKLCYDTLLQYGQTAKISAQNNIVTPALEHIVEANILLSGIGFESGGLATAHSIHNGLTILEETHVYYHGEKVAFGVLTGLVLTDADPKELSTVFSFCENVGLPITLADIGIQNLNKDQLMEVAKRACVPTEGIHHEAGEINPEKVYNAMLLANAIGESRKKNID